MDQGQSSDATGTRDETYDVISIVYHALQGAENCDIYAEDSEQDELRQFFQQAGDQQRQLAEQGKQLLARCLQKEGGQSSSQSGGSAFFGAASRVKAARSSPKAPPPDPSARPTPASVNLAQLRRLRAPEPLSQLQNALRKGVCRAAPTARLHDSGAIHIEVLEDPRV